MKKKPLALYLLALAVLIAALLHLWRRPVSFWEMTGAGREDVYSVSVSAVEMGLKNGRIDNHSYLLEAAPAENEAVSELLDLLEGSQYRPALRNLLPWPADSVETDGKGSVYSVHVAFTWGEQGENFVTLSYLDDDLICLNLHDGGGLLVYRPTDRATLDKLGEFVKENGISDD